MSSLLVYSTHGYTFGISNRLKPLSARVLECSGNDHFDELVDHEAFDLIVIDSSSEEGIAPLIKKAQNSKKNSMACFLYLVPGMAQYDRLDIDHTYTPIIGLSKPINSQELISSCHLLLGLKTRSDRMIRSQIEIEQFATMAAHDLKTPLKNIYSYSDLLLEEMKVFEGDLPEDFHEFSTIIRDETKKMIHFVNDMFDFSMAGRSDLNFTDFNLEILFESILQSVAKEHPHVKYNLNLKGEFETFRGDEVKINHIFQNLFFNSFKYFEGKDVLELTIERQNIGPFETSFSFSDNGPGINEEYLDKIFLPFRRGGSKKPGTGIGLAITKKFIQAHGGEISVESKPSQGVCFSFTILSKKLLKED